MKSIAHGMLLKTDVKIWKKIYISKYVQKNKIKAERYKQPK